MGAGPCSVDGYDTKHSAYQICAPVELGKAKAREEFCNLLAWNGNDRTEQQSWLSTGVLNKGEVIS